jgi:DNA-binding NarL/FixJ family response regulator
VSPHHDRVVAADEAIPLRIVVCGDEAIAREGLAHILGEAGFDVVATAAGGAELATKARAHRPDVVVMELSAAEGDEPLSGAQRIRRDLPETAVLVLSRNPYAEAARALLGDGVAGVGYLMTRHVHDLAALTDAVRRVANGGSELDAEYVEGLVAHSREPDEISRLTPKEREVLGLMAEGYSNLAIAEDLVVTVPAVERHVTSIFSKLDLPRTPDRHRRSRCFATSA